nr:rhomboid family intramembrane serine protease [uncultured Cellulosilyticum sp.]
MNFLDKLERKYRRYAINDLMKYIIIGNGVIFLLEMITRISISSLLSFNLTAILHGQIWRLVTFVFIPDSNSIIFLFFMLYLYYSIGAALEDAWGTFKFNIYYFSGALFTMIASSIFTLITGYSISATAYYINLSLFLAYATLFPNVEFLMFYILPVKVKYLALLDIAFLVYQFIMPGIGQKVLIIVSLLNFLIFFGSSIKGRKPTATQKNFRKQKRELKQGDPIHVAFHKCSVCGKTELTDPDMEFRYCSSCNGNYEYCMDHLKNHEHKK